LLGETAGLVEWPVVLMGEFDKAFLDVPPEVIITSIKSHQKCFSLKTKDQPISNQYLLVSNLIAKDGGQKIVEGNNKVIAARLSDAKFFWELDRKTKLEARLDDLEKSPSTPSWAPSASALPASRRWPARLRKSSAQTLSRRSWRPETCQDRSCHRDGRRVP
jgi:hypothetical protein